MSGFGNVERDLEHEGEKYADKELGQRPGQGGDQGQGQGQGQDDNGLGQGGYQDPRDSGPSVNPGQGGVPGYGDTPYGNQGGTSGHDPSQQDPNNASYDQSEYGTNQDQGSAGGYDAEQQGGYDPNQRGGDQDQ